MTGFRPLHDRILLKRVAAEEKTPGGIIIPDIAKEKPVEGEVPAGAGHRPGYRDRVGDAMQPPKPPSRRASWLEAVWRCSTSQGCWPQGCWTG
ncbi:hypothetical protein [Azospirillum himalayense]|uniref:10 kDa chaperonin n=1 Tax=Azospirillum himalayense TaxID=654847 RepID=A0ABW0G8C7_9PROT